MFGQREGNVFVLKRLEGWTAEVGWRWGERFLRGQETEALQRGCFQLLIPHVHAMYTSYACTCSLRIHF